MRLKSKLLATKWLGCRLNICEPLINFVKAKQAKVADRLEPKGVQLVTPLHVWGYTDIRLPEKRRNLTYHVN